MFRKIHETTPGVPSKKGYVHDHKNRGVQYACQLSVAEHDLELAERMYAYYRGDRANNMGWFKREYCYQVGACPDKERHAREQEERAKAEERLAPEVARRREEDAKDRAKRERREPPRPKGDL